MVQVEMARTRAYPQHLVLQHLYKDWESCMAFLIHTLHCSTMRLQTTVDELVNQVAPSTITIVLD